MFSLVRSALTTGVAIVTASAVVMAPTVQPLPGPDPKIALTAAVYRGVPTTAETLGAAMAALAPFGSSGTPSRLQGAALPGTSVLSFPTPDPAETVIGTGINSAIKNIYYAVEPWVEWGFDVAAYVVSWIPWVGWFAPQISILYDFGEAIVQSIVFNVTDWLTAGLPFLTGLRNVISDAWDAGWNLLWDELDWLLPPLPPLPPIPPCPDILCGGVIANTIVAGSTVLRDASLWIWDLWNDPIKPVIDNGVGIANNVMDALSWVPFVPLIKFETNSVWDIVQAEGDALVGFAQDMIVAGNQAVADFFDRGFFVAAANAIGATWDSILLRGGQAIAGLGAFLKAQWDYFTGGFLDQQSGLRSEQREIAEVAEVSAADSGLSGIPTADAAARRGVNDPAPGAAVGVSDGEAAQLSDPAGPVIESAPVDEPTASSVAPDPATDSGAQEPAGDPLEQGETVAGEQEGEATTDGSEPAGETATDNLSEDVDQESNQAADEDTTSADPAGQSDDNAGESPSPGGGPTQTAAGGANPDQGNDSAAESEKSAA